MSETNSLSNIKVLVTRPVHQAHTLCEMINERGGQAICLPTIEIEAIPLSQLAAERVKNLEQVDFAIFISPNAVEYGLTQLLAQGEIPDKLKLVTIGKSSALKMEQLIGRAPDIYPVDSYNSEALLALSCLQSKAVNNKRVIIFRGRGGRELLATTLRQRGAIVDYAEVYQRSKPEPERSILNDILNSEVDIVTVTSDEGLTNLVSMFSERFNEPQLETLWQMPIVVVTDKMRFNAQKWGFKNAIMVAQKASNEALLDSVQDWVINNILKDKELSNGKK